MTTPDNTQVQELGILFPENGEIELGGETIKVTPLKFKQLKHVLRLAEQFKRIEVEAPLMDASGNLEAVIGKSWNITDLLKLVNENSELVTQALGYAINRPPEFIDELETDDVLKLTAVVVKVNADFFTTRVLPSLTAMTTGLTQLVTQVGVGQK